MSPTIIIWTWFFYGSKVWQKTYINRTSKFTKKKKKRGIKRLTNCDIESSALNQKNDKFSQGWRNRSQADINTTKRLDRHLTKIMWNDFKYLDSLIGVNNARFRKWVLRITSFITLHIIYMMIRSSGIGEINFRNFSLHFVEMRF